MGKKNKHDDAGEDSCDAPASQGQSAEEKPLKLVLRVGQQEEAVGSPSTGERSKHKHKKKKKKKEHEKEKEEENSGQKRTMSDDLSLAEPPKKKANLDEEAVLGEGETIEERVRFSPRTCAPRPSDCAILYQCLEFLQKTLQGKDVNGFFAFPVTDSIAPGYSAIIPIPMDFSTMETKIEKNEYRNIMEYRKDFSLMCNNAMTYNRPETVYYKEAKRLLHMGQKQLSTEKLLTMKKTQSWLSNLSLADIGIHERGKEVEKRPPAPVEATGSTSKPEEPKPPTTSSSKKKRKEVNTPYEPFRDRLTPEEILAQAQGAAKEARQELSMREPKSDLVFLRRNKRGVTTLNILNPDNEGMVSETERVINLGEMVGKLQTGTGLMQGFKEDKRNRVQPIHYVNYGPFSSFAPQFDSSFASVNKDESDLLLATYGDETGVQYAKSVQNFVDSAGDYAVKMVNNLLDMLTKGQHTRTNHAIEQQRKQEKERAAAEEEEAREEATSPSEKAVSPHIDAENTEAPESDDPVQKRLNNTAEMLGDLQRTQDSRLSQAPAPLMPHSQGPSDREMELASKVSEGLAELTSEATPGDLVGVDSLRQAMGISVQALADQAGAHDDDDDDDDDDAPSNARKPLPKSGGAAGTEDEDDDEDSDDDDDDDGSEGSMDEGDEVDGMADEGASRDPTDLSEFFSSSPMQGETSMEG